VTDLEHKLSMIIVDLDKYMEEKVYYLDLLDSEIELIEDIRAVLQYKLDERELDLLGEQIG